MNELSLFSGAGGGLLATKHLLGWNTIGYVEYDEYCQKVLIQRIEDNYLDPAPIFGDIREFNSGGYAEAYQGMVDVITAGFPCPKFSRAGKGEGLEADDLMYHTIHTVSIVEPQYVLWENVEGFIKWEETLRHEVENLGYVHRGGIFNALDFGIPQNRPRYFGVSIQRGSVFSSQHIRWLQREQGSYLQGVQPVLEDTKRRWTSTVSSKEEWRAIFTDAGRRGKTDGVAHRMDRLKAIGNGQVPRVVEVAWHTLTTWKEEKDGSS